MRVLIRHRDIGTRTLLHGIMERLTGFELPEAEQGQAVGDLTGIDAVFAVGPITANDIRRGTFGFIQTMGTGFDHVDIAAATASGVWVSNLPAGETGNAEAVAEWVILLALALFRRLDEGRKNVTVGLVAQPMGRSLLGKTALIVGLGTVGLAVAERLRNFGMKLIATRNDAARGGPDYVRVCAADRLPELVLAADLIVLCARTDAKDKPIINADILSRAKPGSMLINVGRGSLVDYAALERALQDGKLAGAGIDVFPSEPVDPRSTILQLPQVIATPHIAGVTDVNVERSLDFAAENFRRFSRGEIPRFIVNVREVSEPRSGYFPSLDS